MILGIGTDIIEIERINRAINNTPMFLEKIFTKRELEELNRSILRVEILVLQMQLRKFYYEK